MLFCHQGRHAALLLAGPPPDLLLLALEPGSVMGSWGRWVREMETR